ncbi:hypothetical protein T484DRAFT_1648084, partial [Baffinella frigidus]
MNNCPPHSNSSVGSNFVTDCVCQVGYEGENGGDCTECPTGEYKNVTGDSDCVSCPVDTYSDTPGAGSCSNCPTDSSTGNMKSADSRTDCQCNAGYGWTHTSTCRACSVGTYKETTGDHQCFSCDPNTYSSEVGATSCSQCP